MLFIAELQDMGGYSATAEHTLGFATAHSLEFMQSGKCIVAVMKQHRVGWPHSWLG